MSRFYQEQGKRLFDVAGSLLGLLVFAPVLGALAVIVRMRLGAPVLFRQQRPGLNGDVFQLIKFRSMTDACDQHGNVLPDAERLTKMGAFLRRTSLDELPELWNVLRGDMSLVGPRPLLTDYLPYYTVRERRRHTVRPGLTGLAQISGRNLLEWDRRLEMDVQYVEGCSFCRDLIILVKTVGTVVARRGVVVATDTRESRLDVERT